MMHGMFGANTKPDLINCAIIFGNYGNIEQAALIWENCSDGATVECLVHL